MYLKLLSLVTCKVPHAVMVVAEGPKFFEFNTSTLLEKALKALPTQIKFEQAFAFLLFILFGVQLDISLFISSLSLVLSFILYLGKTKRVCMFGKFHFPNVACHGNCYSSLQDLFFSLGKKYLDSTIGICYIWQPLSYRN